MLNKTLDYLRDLKKLNRINMALSRGSATSALRKLDLQRPESWEFSGFSQNGEDGLIDILSSQIERPNRYFIEIGASDGLENNTSWLALARRWSGMWVEGDSETSQAAARIFTALNYGLDFECMFVDTGSAQTLASKALFSEPDLMSLDIDGNDLYVAEALLDAGFAPKIFIVEYNSAFGPDRDVSIPYRPDFQRDNGTGANLYYGCSVAALRRLFERSGYRFISVDSNGVNAVFARLDAFPQEFLAGIIGTPFRENFAQLREYRTGWRGQLALLDKRELVDFP